MAAQAIFFGLLGGLISLSLADRECGQQDSRQQGQAPAKTRPAGKRRRLVFAWATPPSVMIVVIFAIWRWFWGWSNHSEALEQIGYAQHDRQRYDATEYKEQADEQWV